MTARKILVVELPQAALHEELIPMQEYVLRGLNEGVLVLHSGTTLRMEDIPALGAVEVRALAHRLREKDCSPKVPTPTARELPPPTVNRSEPPPKAVSKYRLPMTAGEIAASYRQAAKPLEQIDILADLNACSSDRIREVLAEEGCDVPQKKRGRPKAVVIDG